MSVFLHTALNDYENIIKYAMLPFLIFVEILQLLTGTCVYQDDIISIESNKIRGSDSVKKQHICITQSHEYEQVFIIFYFDLDTYFAN